MTVLLDTGMLYADHDTDATRHEVAAEALASFIVDSRPVVFLATIYQ